MEKNFINARIKSLRKHLKLTQSAFGERLALKNSAISEMEKDGGIISERNITLICEKYNVSREWLTDGTGEMFSVTEDSIFARFAKENNLNEDEQVAARYILRLTPEQRAAVLRHVRELAAELAAKDAAREKLHRQLDEELEKEKTALPVFFFGDSAAAGK